jgi:hypothetical protein
LPCDLRLAPAAQEANGLLVGADQVLEVQDERPAKPLFVERCSELPDVVGLESPTHREDRIAIVCVLNLQHRPSGVATQAARQLTMLKLLEPGGAG